MKKTLSALLVLPLFYTVSGQIPAALQSAVISPPVLDSIATIELMPQRIVWSTAQTDHTVENEAVLLQPQSAQAYFGGKNNVKMIHTGGKTPGIIIDFGCEIYGGIQITTATSNRVTPRVRIRFGESVSETMSTVIGDGTTGLEGGATNHHSVRDMEMVLPGYGTMDIGNTGFRFVRIDFLDSGKTVAIQSIRARCHIRMLDYKGSFECNDNRLNKIWQTGAYTVQLNMQQYLWDGIKRDKMVWLGDMHPEVMTISSVFGYQPIVPKSLDWVKAHTPLPAWMNGIGAYSLWWIIIQHDWYLYHGDLAYLKTQADYLHDLLTLLAKKVDNNGIERLTPGMRYLDWPSSKDSNTVHAGLQALMVTALTKGAVLSGYLGKEEDKEQCTRLAARMRRQLPATAFGKQAAALLSIAGMADAQKMNAAILEGGTKGFSTFFGYYMLQAQALAGDYTHAIQHIRDYWGGMLDLGATTFWEDFDLEAGKQAGRIDDLVPEDKLDFHRNTGDYCYIGLRRSLCHGWASGPTAWLTENVLGIHVLAPGCKSIAIQPHLGDLTWAKGSFPTPYGLVEVSHRRMANGTIDTQIKAPKEIKIIRN